jgi:hypothetical protein
LPESCEETGMIVIRALDGTAVDVNENAVTLVFGPYPHDVGPHNYVRGVDRGVLVTAEGRRGAQRAWGSTRL